MKFYKETTKDWSVPTPNHVYLLTTDKSKLYGYIKAGTEEVTVFGKPYNFDSRRRTFQEVKELGEIDLNKVTVPTWRVNGSKGNMYLVQKIDNVYNCNCSGFKFRGNCRHIAEIEHAQGY
jgi:hypothetical protein